LRVSCISFRRDSDSGAVGAVFSREEVEMKHYAPNKSPEPTAVGPFSSAFAVHVASRRWLSFLR
jgi:hypothetical protein